MQRKILAGAISLLLLMLLAGCLFANKDELEMTGVVIFGITAPDAFQGQYPIERLTITLKNLKSQRTLYKEVLITEQKTKPDPQQTPDQFSETMVVDKVGVGTWSVVVEAQDINYGVIYSKQTKVTVTANKQIIATVELQPTLVDVYFDVYWKDDPGAARAELTLTDEHATKRVIPVNIEQVYMRQGLAHGQTPSLQVGIYTLRLDLYNSQTQNIFWRETQMLVTPDRKLKMLIVSDQKLTATWVRKEPLEAPEALRAVGDHAKITLSWKWFDGQTLYFPKENMDRFKIFRSERRNGPMEIIANGLTGVKFFVDRNVQPGKSYYYWIQSYNESGVVSELAGPVAAAVLSDPKLALDWEHTYGGSSYDVALSIAELANGELVYSGYAASQDGDVSGGHQSADSPGADFWAGKVDSAGKLKWAKCYGGNADEWAQQSVPLSDGGLLMVGFTTSKNTGDITGYHQGSSSGDIWVVKIDASGRLEWQKCLGGESYDWASSVLEVANGEYLIFGGTYSTDGDLLGQRNGTGHSDGWVVKLNANGAIEWQKVYNVGSRDIFNKAMATADGGFMTVGYTIPPVSAIPGQSARETCWVLKADSEGNIQWQKIFSDVTYQYLGFDLIETQGGGYAIVGSSADVSRNLHDGYVNSNFWFLNLDNDGNIIGQNIYGGTNYDCAMSINITRNGHYVLAGSTASGDGQVMGNKYMKGSAPVGWIIKVDGFSGSIIGQRCVKGRIADSLLTPDGGLACAGTVGPDHTPERDVYVCKVRIE